MTRMLLTSVIFLAATEPFCCSFQKDQSLVQNGSFENWKSDVPAGWTVATGATNRNTEKVVKSKVEKGIGSSLQLRGNLKTNDWQFISQSIDLDQNQPYVMSFKAVTKGLKREGRQYDNCWAGIFLKDGRGTDQRKLITNIADTQQREFVLPFKTDKTTKSGQISIFLSKSGQLNVSDVVVSEINLKNSFDVLVADMDRNYSYFHHKKIDWPSLAAKYRNAARACKNSNELVVVLRDLLKELNDGHTWIRHNGKQTNTYVAPPWKPNFDFSVVDNDLKNVKRFGGVGLVGTTSDGLGYVRITSLGGLDNRTQGNLIKAIRGLFARPGIILDLRRNGGGSEKVAQKVAGLFVDEPVTYALNLFRNGPKHDDFIQSSRVLGPAAGKKYKKDLVCLIGPGAVSSAEGFALMMKAIPHCKTIGMPTRGSSGNPAPVFLADGIEVFYSRWMSLTPKGDPIEDMGVEPDETIKHQPGHDPAYRRAKIILAQK